MINYQQQHVRFGFGSLDLRRAPDLVDTLNALRLTNVVRHPDGAWTSRPGQTEVADTVGTNCHSITRADNPMGGQSKIFAGVDTLLRGGTSGTLSAVDSGYSGNPLSLVPWQDRLSGQGWLIVGDSSRVRKVRVSDNLVLPIGLAAPSAAVTAALASANETAIEAFESGFTARAGSGLAPTLSYVAGKDGNCLQMETAPSGTTAPYYNFAEKAISVDLTTFGVGQPDITDDDYMHLWLRMDNPLTIQEVRVYLVTGTFTANTIPGVTTGANTTAFMKAFRPSDVSSMIGTGATAQAATQIAVGRRIYDEALRVPTQDGFIQDTGDPDTVTQVREEPVGAGSRQSLAGTAAWTEFASVGIPLRRGDFQPIGDNPDWSAVSGIIIYVSVSTATVATIRIDDFYCFGGAGPDTGEPGTQKYDWLATNYDPRTGAEGNGSAVMAESAWMDTLRTGVVLTPAAHSDSAMRQRFYRRGGTLADEWRFVGVNTANGGTFTDTLGDLEIAAADVVPDDHFAAVPSVNSNGAAVLGQATPYWWGPAQGVIFTAGDPNRPGGVYFCKPDAVDHWGANDYVNVSSPSEAVLGGFMLGESAFAWTNKGLHALYINLNDATSVTSQRTDCTRGLAAPWAFTVGGGACFFVAPDGVFATNGGQERALSDGFVRPLFEGESSNGLLPIDWTATTALRCSFWQNELWVSYQDTGGTKRHLIYHVLDQVWRAATFGRVTSAGFADTKVGVNRFLLGGATTGKIYSYSGFSDDGLEIAANIRTGALTQGYPKADKLYADVTLDIDRDGEEVTLAPLLTNQTDAETTLTIDSGTGRQPYIYSFSGGPQRSPNCALDLSWSSETTRPKAYAAILTYTVEPPTVKSWTSLPMDHGLVGWHLPTTVFLTLRSNAAVTLTVTATSQTGTLSTQTYTISSTSFAKQKRWVSLYAQKGVLFTYALSSTEPFIIYGDESSVTAQPWGQEGAVNVSLFQPARDTSHAQSVYTSGAALAAGGG